MALSSAAIASMHAEDTDEVWLVLLTISHDDLDAPIRVVNNTEDIVSDGLTYIALPFELELPDQGERPGEARIRIDNVNRAIVEAVRTIQAPPNVAFKIILASQPDVIEYEHSGLTLRDVTYDVASVQGYLRYEDLTSEPVADTITPSRFPGLF